MIFQVSKNKEKLNSKITFSHSGPLIFAHSDPTKNVLNIFARHRNRKKHVLDPWKIEKTCHRNRDLQNLLSMQKSSRFVPKNEKLAIQ